MGNEYGEQSMVRLEQVSKPTATEKKLCPPRLDVEIKRGERVAVMGPSGSVNRPC
jgi:ABC-type lipoprotein export system ATPase subunit